MDLKTRMALVRLQGKVKTLELEAVQADVPTLTLNRIRSIQLDIQAMIDRG